METGTYTGTAGRVKLAGLILLSAALLLTAYFHIGWRVSVGGRALDGVYRPADVIGSLQGAKLLSGEILGEEAKLDVTLTPAVTRDDYAADIRVIGLLAVTDSTGIVPACAVYADGEFVGYAGDESVLGELISVMLRAPADPETARPETPEIYLRRTYVTPETKRDPAAVMRRIRDT